MARLDAIVFETATLDELIAEAALDAPVPPPPHATRETLPAIIELVFILVAVFSAEDFLSLFLLG